MSSPVVDVEQRSLLDNCFVKSPDREDSQEERVHVDQKAVENVGGEDGGKMESEPGADDHEEDAGDDGVGDGVEEADHHDDGADAEHGSGEHGREVSTLVDDDRNHVLQILSTVILSWTGAVGAKLRWLRRWLMLLISRSRWWRRCLLMSW